MDESTPDVVFRPMRPEDVPAAERLSAEGFYELDTRMARRSWPEPVPRPADRGAHWVTRTLHFLRTDPGGCWVAEDASGLLGIATSFNREKLWCLATYAVRPGLQGRGIGKPLLAAALRPRPRVAARDALVVGGPQGRAALPAGGLLAAPADVPDRDRGPVRDPGARQGPRGQGPRGHGRRHRPDGLGRPADAWRGARSGPRGDARLLAAAGRPTPRRARATPTPTRTATSRCSRPPTGVRPPGCCGRPWPTPTARSASPT